MYRSDSNMGSVVARMLATFIFIFAMLSFSSCNANFVPESEQSYYAYIVESFATLDSESGYVRIGFTADDSTKNLMEGVEVKSEKLVKQTFWFNYANYVYTVDGTAVQSAVLDYIANFDGETDEEKATALRLKNVNSENLKVLYQYATIYKSTTTNGTLVKQNKNYIHTWEYALGEEITVQIGLRNEVRASWYALVIGSALLVITILVPLTISASRKRKEKQEVFDIENIVNNKTDADNEQTDNKKLDNEWTDKETDKKKLDNEQLDKKR